MQPVVSFIEMDVVINGGSGPASVTSTMLVQRPIVVTTLNLKMKAGGVTLRYSRLSTYHYAMVKKV